MTASGNDVDPGLGNEAGKFGRITHRNDLVRLAPEDLRGHIDTMQPLVQVRIKKPWFPGEFGHRVLVLDHRLILIRCQHLREHAISDRLIDKELAHPLLGRPQKDVAATEAGHIESGRSDHRNGSDAGGAAHRNLEREPATDRGTHQNHIRQIEALEEVQIEEGHVVDVVEPGGLVGVTKAGVLGHDHIEIASKVTHERRNARRTARPVQVKECASNTASAHRSAAPIHLDHRL